MPYHCPPSPRSYRILLCLVLGLLAGCHRNDQSVPSPAQAQTAIQDAFKDANPRIKALAREVATEIQNQQPTKAFVQLYAMKASPALTSDQQVAVLQSIAAVNLQLQVAATKGDAEAAKLLQFYGASR